jgi:hypothetical protein
MFIIRKQQVLEGDSGKPGIGMSVHGISIFEFVSCTLHDIVITLGNNVLCNIEVVVLLLMKEASKPVSKSDSFTIQ